MRIIAFLLLSLWSGVLNAQVKHSVSLGAASFTPSTLTIDIGDTVEWTNGLTLHNVNGTTTSYPANPVSFGNAIAANWTFSHVFDTPGSYDYQCDVHVLLGMVGLIKVQTGGTTGIPKPALNPISIFPNPSSGLLWIENVSGSGSVSIYNTSGKLVQKENLHHSQVDIRKLPVGIYWIKIRSGEELILLKGIVKI